MEQTGAIFRASYHVVVSLITTGMSIFHNGSLVKMPLYFLILSTEMFVLSRMLFVNKVKTINFKKLMNKPPIKSKFFKGRFFF
ncbi:hypothetical protein CWS20_08525 [Cytobacillus horneckiae]|uniref:Uncharacterized protein n=1 Tax=Cytobacillus horneckiae TaxID=549687 RepID=A0A2N0ZIG0_9BACI|nr:hypothetical protein CWS20_08525 [Cytobacillus horneckiae]